MRVQACAWARGRAVSPMSLRAAHAVIDGDTIAIGTMRIGLESIDAPEAAQTAGEGGGTWACGGAAALALSVRIGSKAVETPGWCAKVMHGLRAVLRDLIRARGGGQGRRPRHLAVPLTWSRELSVRRRQPQSR